MNLLLEEMPVDDVVQATIDRYKDDILQALDEAPYQESEYRGVVNSIVIKSKCVFCNIDLDGRIIYTVIKLYDFHSNEECEKYVQDIQDMCGTFYQDRMVIKVAYPSINGVYGQNDILSCLAHELEHARQFIKSGEKSKINDLYKWMLTELPQIQGSAAQILGQMIYYFNNKEISARIQEVYNQLKELKVKSKEDIEQSQVVKQFFEMDAYLDRFLVRTDILNDAIKLLKAHGFNGKAVIRMIQAKRYAMKKKMIKMIGCYLTRVEDGLFEDHLFRPYLNAKIILEKYLL